jgi:hypothetical protein
MPSSGTRRGSKDVKTVSEPGISGQSHGIATASSDTGAAPRSRRRRGSVVDRHIARFDEAMATRGWICVERALDSGFVDAINRELETAYAVNRALQVKNGVADHTDGTVHHLPCQRGLFLDLLERNPCAPLLDRFFGGPYILNTFGGVLNLPDNLSYVGLVHRDLRTFSGDIPLMAQLLVMLDDFTEANGATYFLGGSHRQALRPTDEDFFRRAERVTGPAGSIVVFNSNIWHAAGANTTGGPRRALTLAFTKPFIKQQLDYPRALADVALEGSSDRLRQLLGFNARVPASLDEWYQPPERRLYKRDQG